MIFRNLFLRRPVIGGVALSALLLTTSFTNVSCNQSGNQNVGKSETASVVAGGASSGVPLANPTVLEPNLFVNLAKKVVPSVVNISTSSIVKSPYAQGAPDDLYRRFFEDFFGGQPGGPQGQPWGGRRGGPAKPKEMPRALSLGTGFIIDSSGLILTNNHVVENADEITIAFTEDPNEKPTQAEVVGRDPELDVALIKVKSSREMIPLPLGDSDALQVGEYVMAVGNPFGQGHSVTHGIISAKGRLLSNSSFGTSLQTDTPINPGNSGGPLVNLKGEVIGINNAIDARAQGIGFAIPSNAVKSILDQLREKGSVSRGYIGVLVGPLTPEVAQQINAPKDLNAPFVTHIYPGEPADKAGIKPYDVILEFNGKPVTSSTDLVRAVTSVKVGESAPIKVLREGKEKTLKMTVAKRPNGEVAAPQKKGPAPTPQADTGMELQDITPELARQLGMAGKPTGILVTDVATGSPAEQAGLIRGDVIIEVDRKEVSNIAAFNRLIQPKKRNLIRIRRVSPAGQEGFAVIVLDLKAE